MRKQILSLPIIIGMVVLASFAYGENATPEQMVEKIHWLGQSTIKIEVGEKIIYRKL
jgi:hypothetical protein